MKALKLFILPLVVSVSVFAQDRIGGPRLRVFKVNYSQVCIDYFGISIFRTAKEAKERGAGCKLENRLAYFETNDPNTQHQYGMQIPELGVSFNTFSWVGGKPYDYKKGEYLENAYEAQKAIRTNAFYEKIWAAVNAKMNFDITVEANSNDLLEIQVKN